MTKDDIQLLYEYDRWANNKVLQAVSALSAEPFTRDLGGSFHSVRDTLVHIMGGEWGWLAYWKGPSHSSAFLTDLRARRDALFNPDAFPNAAAVQLKWAEVEKDQVEFVNRVTNDSLEKMLPFRTTQIRLAHLIIAVESRVRPEVLQALRDKGHNLTVHQEYTARMGRGQAVIHNSKSGMNSAASDPRADGVAESEPPEIHF